VFEEGIRAWQHADLAISARSDLFLVSLPMNISELSLPSWVSASLQFNYIFVTLAFVELLLGDADRTHARLNQSRKFAHEAGAKVVEILADFLTTTLTLTSGHTDAATAQAFECLRRFGQLGYGSGIVCSLIQVADIVARRGDLRSACKLIGVAESHLEALNDMVLYVAYIALVWHRQTQDTIVAPTLAAARAALGDAVFEAAYAEGQRMTLDEAVALALTNKCISADSQRDPEP